MENALYHHGILGMKWGVRRKNPSGVSSAPKATKASQSNSQAKNEGQKTASVVRSDDSTRKDLIKIKGLNEMTNAEIKQINERLQLEKNFRELTKPKESAGRKFISDVVTNAAKQTATTYVAKYMSKGIDGLLKKAAK